MFVLVILLSLIFASFISSVFAGLVFLFIHFVMKKQVTKRFLIVAGIIGLVLFLMFMAALCIHV